MENKTTIIRIGSFLIVLLGVTFLSSVAVADSGELPESNWGYGSDWDVKEDTGWVESDCIGGIEYRLVVRRNKTGLFGGEHEWQLLGWLRNTNDFAVGGAMHIALDDESVIDGTLLYADPPYDDDHPGSYPHKIPPEQYAGRQASWRGRSLSRIGEPIQLSEFSSIEVKFGDEVTTEPFGFGDPRLLEAGVTIRSYSNPTFECGDDLFVGGGTVRAFGPDREWMDIDIPQGYRREQAIELIFRELGVEVPEAEEEDDSDSDSDGGAISF